MRLGTKSLLFGCHQFILHPLYTLVAWIRLYGVRSLDFQTLLAITVHDWGYWGCHTMDGWDGFYHPTRISQFLVRFPKTHHLVRNHSRHLCDRIGGMPSRLCWVDKLGTGMMPSKLWVLLAWFSGEGREYIANPYGQDFVEGGKYSLWGLVEFHCKYKLEWGPGGSRWD